MPNLQPKKPSWLKVKIPSGEKYKWIKEQRSRLKLATVCEEANCPNIGECWSAGTATFMVMGDTCTRGCSFCSVKTSRQPAALDNFEPIKLATTLRHMALDYVVLTTVDRDDLADQGALHIRSCIETVQEYNPKLKVEILMPDFRGETKLVDQVIAAKPAVLAHNVETVERLTKKVRDKRAGYQQSLNVLKHIKRQEPKAYTKSSLMVGLGETTEEIIQAMQDLRAVGTDFLTIGQYLKPNTRKMNVETYIHPETFEYYKQEGLNMGFRYVASGPLVRSSYKAAEQFIYGMLD